MNEFFRPNITKKTEGEKYVDVEAKRLEKFQEELKEDESNINQRLEEIKSSKEELVLRINEQGFDAESEESLNNLLNDIYRLLNAFREKWAKRDLTERYPDKVSNIDLTDDVKGVKDLLQSEIDELEQYIEAMNQGDESENE